MGSRLTRLAIPSDWTSPWMLLVAGQHQSQRVPALDRERRQRIENAQRTWVHPISVVDNQDRCLPGACLFVREVRDDPQQLVVGIGGGFDTKLPDHLCQKVVGLQLASVDISNVGIGR